MEKNTGAVVAYGVLRATKSRLNLWIAGAMTASALIFQSLTLLLATLVGFLGLVVWHMTRPGFWRATLSELRRRPVDLPAATEFLDNNARQFVHRLTAVRAQLAVVLEQHQPVAAARLQSLLEGARHLEERARALLARLDDLCRYLVDKNPETIRREIDRLTRQGEFTGHAQLKIECARARASLERQLSELQSLYASRELLVVRLEAVTGTLETLPHHLVRLDVTAAEGRDERDEIADGRVLDLDQDPFDDLGLGGVPDRLARSIRNASAP